MCCVRVLFGDLHACVQVLFVGPGPAYCGHGHVYVALASSTWPCPAAAANPPPFQGKSQVWHVKFRVGLAHRCGRCCVVFVFVFGFMFVFVFGNPSSDNVVFGQCSTMNCSDIVEFGLCSVNVVFCSKGHFLERVFVFGERCSGPALIYIYI